MIFINLANGVPLAGVMAAFRRSEKEVMDDFWFVASKIRSYRFERGAPMLPILSIADARGANRAAILLTLRNVNLTVDPKFSKIDTEKLDYGEGGRPSDAELRLFEVRSRAAERPRHGG